jgi:hypothetical protein
MTYESAPKQPGERPQKLTIAGREFEFVTSQREGISAVYRSADSYLRIGLPKKILRDLALHKNMEKAGFPVATILGEGEENGEAYFIETSLGDKHFGDLFAEDVATTGSIRTETFQQFISICEQFARAQLTTRSETKDCAEFAKGIWLPQLCDELPDHADAIIARFETLRKHTEQLPFVLTHGDFNPNNLYPKGVIDLEDAFPGPYGYDLVSAVNHIDSFPTSEGYEYFAKYHFTEAQIQEFSERMNVISNEAGLELLTEFWNDFEFCRAVWLAADIPNTPKLQKFRHDFVIEKFLAQ